MEHSTRNRRRGSDPYGKPSELLQKIGLLGKEVVKILKRIGWEVCDPKALQEHKLYYVPGGRGKGELAVQGEDFFVGEGELYAYILEQGGIRFLLPDERWSTESKMESESDVEILEQPRPEAKKQTLNPTKAELGDRGGEEQSKNFVDPSPNFLGPKDDNDSLSHEALPITSKSASSQPPQRKRRKKLSPADGKTASKAKPVKHQVRKPRKKPAQTQDSPQLPAPIKAVKEESIPFVAADGCGQLVQFGAYEAALTARGWRAQLLQDIDLHLLRSVAGIARRQLALAAAGGCDQKFFVRLGEDARPHEGILQELKTLSSGIKASQNDLSSMIAAVIAQAERVEVPARIECAARIGIPAFVSTGSGSLVLLRDIERHVLLIVAAMRQYLRARNIANHSDCDNSAHGGVKRPDLRALQLNIEKMNAELNELSTIISSQAEILSRKNSSTTPIEIDADMETDSEQWLV
ncbi:uncharacterized protein IUM83_13996 [Phytophthora cinnamomi]|uniref:uncharacterized protein n=1 Tax=Phytophthora cinnamomi TaxID=4785 RepID=UPI003559E0D3|nr:hypothetical protein IUM83_13996 [Phytophthora cinnamomi]